MIAITGYLSYSYEKTGFRCFLVDLTSKHFWGHACPLG